MKRVKLVNSKGQSTMLLPHRVNRYIEMGWSYPKPKAVRKPSKKSVKGVEDVK